MYRVRYYDQLIHPDHFKGSGLRGVFVVVLNWIRWKLETLVQKSVLKWLASNGSLPESQVKEYLRTFSLDVKAEALEKEQTSPLHEKVEQSGVQPIVRADRYEAGSVKSALASETSGSDVPKRPMRLDNLIASYGMDTRAKKYTKGFKFQVSDPEGDFEPLEET